MAMHKADGLAMDDVNTNSVVVACMALYERMLIIEINHESQCVLWFCGGC